MNDTSSRMCPLRGTIGGLKTSLWQAGAQVRMAVILALCLAAVLTGSVPLVDSGQALYASPSRGQPLATAHAKEEKDHQDQSPRIAATQQPSPVPTRTPVHLYFPVYIRRPTPVRVYFPIIGNTRIMPTPTATPAPTSAPAPTPTPTPPWPQPLEKPGRSKLGLHVEWNNSPDIMEFIRRTKPAVVKAVGDLGFLVEVKEASPSTVTVARLAQGPQKTEGDPAMAARAFVAKNLDQYHLNAGVDYWEGWNEPGIHGRMDWYAAFEAERVRLMAEHGFRAAVGAFSTGVPEWEEFAAFLPAIEAAHKYGGILTLHEYNAPTMDRWVGIALPGRSTYPDRGALTLRYRWWYEDFLKPRGLVVPLVISELGIDGGLPNRPGPKGLGWRDFAPYWTAHDLGDDGAEAYIRQLAWYDTELQRDDYVIGFAVFTAGVITERWDTYDVTEILRPIAVYVVEQR